MALGATGSPDLAERVSEASARELKLVGLNWTYSPVADVNSDPRNPVIGLFVPTSRFDALSYLSRRRAVFW